MAQLESLGTLDKVSEILSMTKTQKTVEEPEEFVDLVPFHLHLFESAFASLWEMKA